jgi:SH3 domain protein
MPQSPKRRIAMPTNAAPLLLLLLLALLQPVGAAAQTQRYISDEVFVVLHAGPGANYRWLGKLTPGTPLTERGNSEDGEWVEVITERGTQGWVRSEFVTSTTPAQVRVPQLNRELENSERTAAELRATVTRLKEDLAALDGLQSDTASQLQSVTEELAQLRQISGSALETAEQNRRLVTEAESMRTAIDTLQADNQRLQERVRSSAFLDGAIAVALGVIITLVVPRLWPRRRRSSSWA